MRKARHVFSVNYLLYICNNIFNYPKIIKRNNIKIFMDNNIMPKANRKLLFFKANEYEYNEIKLINKANILQDDNILELGSCIGITAIHLKRKLRTGNLFCIEPNPSAYKCLVKNLQMNNIIAKTYNAVGSVNEKYIDFKIDQENFLSCNGKKNLIIEIKSININNMISKFNINTLLIDVEGFEIEIFNKINFLNIKTLIIELHPDIYGQKKLDKILTFLKRNYKISDKSNSVYCFSRL